MDFFKAESSKHVGPGGLRCPCCRPKAAHGTGWKKALRRRVRHALNRKIRQVIWAAH